MSNLSLFVVGTLVTLLVAAAMGLLVWGAILDGRTQREFEAAERRSAEREDGTPLHVVDAA
jgi:hypothetical protein